MLAESDLLVLNYVYTKTIQINFLHKLGAVQLNKSLQLNF